MPSIFGWKTFCKAPKLTFIQGLIHFRHYYKFIGTETCVVVFYRNQAILKNIDFDLPTLENSCLLKFTFSQPDSLTKKTDLKKGKINRKIMSN